MRVLYDYQIFAGQEYGGVSRYFHEISSRLSRRPEWNVRILSPLHINQYVGRGARVLGIRTPYRGRGGKLIRAADALATRMMVPFLRPEILHRTYYWEATRSPVGTKTVVTVYDMIHEKMRSHFPKDDPTPAQKERAVRSADHVICISENTRKDLLELIPIDPSRVSVVHLGYSLNAKDAGPRPVEFPYLLFVGDRGGYKNFSRLLEAFAASERLSADFGIVCFGGGVFRPEVRALIQKLRLDPERIRQISGDDSRLAGAYQGAAAFVYPSLYEGFGIPPLEAMALGCPVVCSRTSSLPEVVGDAAELFDPERTESISAALESVVFDSVKVAQLRALGYERIKGFSWEKCAEETAKVYLSLR